MPRPGRARKAAEVSHHTGRNGRQPPEGGRHTRWRAGKAAKRWRDTWRRDTCAAMAVQDPFAFMDDEPGKPDEPVPAGSTQIDSKTAEDHECVCPACGNTHRKES